MMTSDPILAVMKALDSGVRPQAMAELEEVGCKVQTSGNRGAGASHGGEYTPVWVYIRQCEEHRPDRAAVLYTLFALNEEDSNAWVDAMHELIVAALARQIDGWAKLRAKKRDQIEWLAFAAIIERRSDLERVKPAWGPEQFRYYLADQHGVSLPQHNWQRDWQPLLNKARDAIEAAEDDVLLPVSSIIKRERSIERNSMPKAA